jgi:hypothetical protein
MSMFPVWSWLYSLIRKEPDDERKLDDEEEDEDTSAFADREERKLQSAAANK